MTRKTDPVELESLDARELQAAIADDPKATANVLAYLEARGEEHSGQISGATLASVAGVDSRTWRKWTGGEREFPISARRAIIAAAWGTR